MIIDKCSQIMGKSIPLRSNGLLLTKRPNQKFTCIKLIKTFAILLANGRTHALLSFRKNKTKFEYHFMYITFNSADALEGMHSACPKSGTIKRVEHNFH
jgi:hypothetical protein